jgi:hypothetical protein
MKIRIVTGGGDVYLQPLKGDTGFHILRHTFSDAKKT